MKLVRKRMTLKKLLALLSQDAESDTLDFKLCLDLATTRAKYEFLKDVAAFSNASGGYMVLGRADDGTSPGISEVIDPADLHNVVESFFGCSLGIDYRQFTLQDQASFGLLYIPSTTDQVVVMPKDGSYPDGGKTRSVFSRGDVYFRRGSRSIKACSHDYQAIMSKLRASVPTDAEAANVHRRGSPQDMSRAISSLARHWSKLSGKDSVLTEHGKTSLVRFLQQLTSDELKSAMDIAFAKALPDNEARFRYFCGIVHNRIDEKCGDSVRSRLRQARGYYKGKPAGSGYFVDERFRKYAERFDLDTLKRAIDETFSEPRTSYFASLCEILDSYTEAEQPVSALVCSFCDGTGDEPLTAVDAEDRNPIPCRICNGKGIIAVAADSDIVSCKVCGASGKLVEDGYFLGNECPACMGLGYQALTGSIRVVT